MIENLKTYNFRECNVLISKDMDRWHLSISNPNRYPTWDEIKEARYKFLPDNIFMVMVLPPKKNYVSLHPNCFHLWETKDPEAEDIWNG
jgi:hypothetical protein